MNPGTLAVGVAFALALWAADKLWIRFRAPHVTCRHCRHPVLHHRTHDGSDNHYARYGGDDCYWCADCIEARDEVRT